MKTNLTPSSQHSFPWSLQKYVMDAKMSLKMHANNGTTGNFIRECQLTSQGTESWETKDTLIPGFQGYSLLNGIMWVELDHSN